MHARISGFSIARRRRGQAMVELALVLPVLALVLVTVVDFARVFYLSIAVKNAARAGVQYGVQSLSKAGDLSGMQQAAQNDALSVPGLTATAKEFCQCPGGPSVVCSPLLTCPGLHLYVQVQTSAQFSTLLNYPGVPSTVTLSGNAVMRAQ